jgi:hypothetical protein
VRQESDGAVGDIHAHDTAAAFGGDPARDHAAPRGRIGEGCPHVAAGVVGGFREAACAEGCEGVGREAEVNGERRVGDAVGDGVGVAVADGLLKEDEGRVGREHHAHAAAVGTGEDERVKREGVPFEGGDRDVGRREGVGGGEDLAGGAFREGEAAGLRVERGPDPRVLYGRLRRGGAGDRQKEECGETDVFHATF